MEIYVYPVIPFFLKPLRCCLFCCNYLLAYDAADTLVQYAPRQLLTWHFTGACWIKRYNIYFLNVRYYYMCITTITQQILLYSDFVMHWCSGQLLIFRYILELASIMSCFSFCRLKQQLCLLYIVTRYSLVIELYIPTRHRLHCQTGLC